MAILTITQLNRYVAFRLKEDAAINGILVRGEVSNFTRNSRSGHCYFTLKDEECAVKAVMFRGMAQRLRFEPRDGMSVIAAASASLYERDGAFQLYVTDMQQDGMGQQQEALKQLRQKLSAMGVFSPETKRPLPPFPKKIGVITSATGAALRDVMQVIGRRYPIGTLAIFPAQVQGEAAPASICHAIAAAEAAECDVLIVGRGGGSAEDLNAFNTEQVVMAIYNCAVPVISAVGHETDITLSDAAADLRAPTPSAAAELAVPDREALQGMVQEKSQQLVRAMQQRLEACRQMLTQQHQRLLLNAPKRQQLQAQQQLSDLTKRLHHAMLTQMSRNEQTLQKELVRLEALSPLKILSRGYALVYHGEELLRDAASVQADDELTVQLGTGKLRVKVLEHRKDEQDDI